MSKFVILLNGDVTMTGRLNSQMTGARVIAVDGGMRHAHPLGVIPECWIGDFDSSASDLQNQWSDIARLEYPVEKDKTDGELALDYVVEHGATEIILIGGLGGHIDHVVCHITQLTDLATRNIRCFASSGRQEAWPLVAGALRWDFPKGTRLSLLGLTALKNLSLSGVKWPLSSQDVDFGSSLTMSNEVTGPVSGHLGEGFGVALVAPAGKV